MITDTLDRLALYMPPYEGRTIMELIASLAPDVAEGRRMIRGEEIFANIARYETKPREAAYPEAHRKYADIQLLLSGHEGIEWFPLEGLTERTAYDPERDFAIYERPPYVSGITVLGPGIFALYMPTDAHMPQLSLTLAPATVTKVVVKVEVGLLYNVQK